MALQATAQIVTESFNKKVGTVERREPQTALNLGTVNSYKSKPKSSLDVWIEFIKSE